MYTIASAGAEVAAASRGTSDGSGGGGSRLFTTLSISLVTTIVAREEHDGEPGGRGRAARSPSWRAGGSRKRDGAQREQARRT